MIMFARRWSRQRDRSPVPAFAKDIAVIVAVSVDTAAAKRQVNGYIVG